MKAAKIFAPPYEEKSAVNSPGSAHRNHAAFPSRLSIFHFLLFFLLAAGFFAGALRVYPHIYTYNNEHALTTYL